MHKTIGAIYSKVNDYKLCKDCNNINWYENERCHYCNSDKFRKDGIGILEFLDDDYEHYEKEGYTETEIDDIELDI